MSLAETSILLVDDEKLVRKSLARNLQQKHFTVTDVASGSEAINALKDKEYYLVITDVMMPDVDGFEVLKTAKKLAPLTSVIILSGYGDTQSAIDALRLGADDFLRKPCEVEELVFRITSCLEKRNLLLERQKTMKDLQESKTFILATLNALSAEIAVLDFNGQIVAVNDSWRNFALENGLEADKFAPIIEVGVNYLSVCKAVTGIESEDALKSCEGIQAVLDGRLSSFNLEYPCHSPEQERWFNMNVNPLVVENQRHVVVAHTNITELKKTEEALRQSEQRRCLTLELAHAGTWEWDIQTNISIWSDQLWALHELEPRGHGISYEEWLETIHPDDLLKTDRTIKKSVLHGEEINVEWRVKLNNEKERWLMSRGLPLKDGQDRVVLYLGIIMDITQCKVHLNKRH
jgi:CheY-like chemotaxis protein/PAS domain-containing protein